MFATPRSPARRRSRGLRFEALESRLALTGLAEAISAGSLAEYLSQPAEPGPVIEEAAVGGDPAASDPLLDELIDQVAMETLPPTVETLEGEGEDPLDPVAEPLPDPITEPLPDPITEPLPGPLPDPTAPTLTSFSVEHIDGGWVRLFGTVSAADPAGIAIEFGGLFEGESTTTDDLGNFSLQVPYPGSSGFVTATAEGSTTFLSAYLD